MEKILFIESRYVTNLYDGIARKLENDGHNVKFLILNQEFIPNNKNSIVIDYPKERVDTAISEENNYLEEIIKIDRQIRFYNKRTINHFFYYDREIKRIINDFKPDFVFGEPTSFHHLITIEICRRRNIRYYHPASCRYPVNRFAFYEYDTLIPFGGSGEKLDNDIAVSTISEIVEGKRPPNYMLPRTKSFFEKLGDKIKISKGYLKGERFNTPSPLVKFLKEKSKRKLLENWDQISCLNVDPTKFSILFPLHMQPESSIDVWGRPFSNQCQVIENISNCLVEGEILYIKPNPKSAFEISSELIDLVKKRDNIKALNTEVRMSDVFSQIDLVVNIVGTVAIECILSNKPVISLVKTYFNSSPNTHLFKSYDDIREFISKLKEGNFNYLSIQEKVDYINYLNSLSYNGIIADTFNNSEVLSEENLNNLYKGFKDILGKC